MLMIALGCGFFTGLRAVAPAMMGAASDYVRESSLMDLRLRSNIGVKSDEIAAVRNAAGVKGAFAGYTKELCYKNDKSIIIKAFSIPENISPDSVNFLNRPYVVEGRLPKTKNECAVELKLTSPKEFKVGAELALTTSDPENDPLENTLARDSFTIVGVVISPMFLGYERDSASVGDGVVNSNIYIPESDFVCDYYTDMFVTLDIPESLDPFSEEYKTAVAERGKDAARAFEESETARYDKLKENAQNKIDNAEGSISRAEEMLAAEPAELEERLEEARQLAEQTRKKYGGSKSIIAKAAVSRAELQVKTLESLLNDDSGEFRQSLEEELAAARTELEEGRAQLAAAPELRIYKDDRFSFSDYESFRADTEKTARLAQAFPPFFALTAALVCLTAMSRMVDEQRVTIGAYRALGYGGGAILARFLIYGVSAALIGSAGGSAAGMKVLPAVMINTYKVLYNIPMTRSAFRKDYLIISAAVSVTLVSAAAVYTCRKELSAQTAELLRPRPPVSGKRTLLERIGFIWRRLGFISKVTARNLFRYKKRALMTIVGVAGCSALITAGFGLRGSVLSILEKQFGGILTYSAMVFSGNESCAEELAECAGIESALPVEWRTLSAGNNDKKYSANLIASGGELEGYFTLRDPKNGQKLSQTGGAVVTEKLAKLCGLTVGGDIEIRTNEGDLVSFSITGIAENYAVNYVFIDREMFKERFPGSHETNLVLVNTDEKLDKQELTQSIMSVNGALGIMWLSDLESSFSDRSGLMDKIILILIFCAMLLAATVLYNLADINITERQRELASLKVLGFYDKETAAYIFRETFALTLIGLIPGAIFGKLLHSYLISAIEIDVLMFVRELSPGAVLYGSLLTVLFSLLVSGALYFKLIKIDPAVSLKSVE